MIKGDVYLCENCKEENICGWDDEEANIESKRLFGVEAASHRMDFMIVCDDCFHSMGF